MYNDYFGFSESPFENNLDQRFLFLSEDHKEVLAALLYCIKENKAFAMLCGDVGAGKTMLINCFFDRLPESHTPIIISNPSVEYREILLYVAQSLGITDKGQKVLDLIDEVKNALVGRKKDGKYYFLVIDEAHLLSDQSLDDIRLLSNIETPDRKLLPILLVGQYELSYKLQNQKMRQLRQRISVNRFLSSLDYVETSRYIDHRLKLVGSNFASCFEAHCLPLIYKLTDGVPRQINQICDNAFLVCKTAGIKKVNKKIVKKTHKALRSDLLFTPKFFKEKSEKTFMPWKIVKPAAFGSVIVLLLIGWLYYGGFIKPFVFQIIPQKLNQKVITPNVERDRVQEKKSEVPQPIPEGQNPLPSEKKSQLNREINPLSSTTTTDTKFPEALSQTPDNVLLKPNTAVPSSNNPPQVSPKGPQLTSPLSSASSQKPHTSIVSSEVLRKKSSPKLSSSSASLRQTGETDLKGNQFLTMPNSEQKGESRESNQQFSSEIAINQSLASSNKADTGAREFQNNQSTEKKDEQSVTTPKVVVKTGDNLTEIALQHYPNKEMSGVEAILKANPQIENSDLIYPGQVLILPEIDTESNSMLEADKKSETRFVVQICTLLKSNRAFAEAYINELKQKGYPAYSTEVKTNEGKIIYKIFIGKYPNKDEAEAAALDFQKKEGRPDIIIESEVEKSPEPKKEEK